MIRGTGNSGIILSVSRVRKAAEIIDCPITTGSPRNRRFLNIFPVTCHFGHGAGTVLLAEQPARIIRLGAMKIVNLQGAVRPQSVLTTAFWAVKMMRDQRTPALFW